MSVRKVLLTLIVIVMPLLAAAQEQPKPATELLEAAAPAAAIDATEVPEGGVPRYVKEETPKERMDRIGTQEDPGISPDPEKVWMRYGKKYNIRRYEKEFSRFFPDKPNLVRPVANVNFTFEIYQVNDKYVWVWMQVLEPRKSREELKKAEDTIVVPKETVEYLTAIRDEFTPLDPPTAPVKVTFEEASDGLPNTGSWRNAPAVADMNNDGFVDIVLPPQRAGNGLPLIYLGDGTGHWQPWKVTWPTHINYGAVVAADFNKDKNMDLAFAIHLSGVAVFYGDGKGDFREAYYDKAFPSRRLITADIDRDGWMDVVAITEGPSGRSADPKAKEYTALRGYLNREKGAKWEGLNIAHPKDNTSGDWLTSGYFNGDKYPDFLTSTIYFNGTSTVHLSQNAPKKYDFFWDGKGYVIPFRSYYYAVAAGKFSNKDRDDAIVSHFRTWPQKMDQEILPDPPLTQVVGIDRISFSADGKQARRAPIVRWAAGRAVPGMSSGDFDRDGKQDIMFTRHDPREAVLLLGDGKGGFARAQIEGIALRPLSNYDLTVADVNNDKRPDVIVMYEAESATSLSHKNGSVHVYVNKSTVAGQTAAAK
jgi:FG-GAP-like repeat